MPHIERPFRSPLGVPGAAIALVIALATLVFLFANDEYRVGVIGAAIWYAAGLLWFWLHARKRMVLSPEEAFAVEMGHGAPRD